MKRLLLRTKLLAALLLFTLCSLAFSSCESDSPYGYADPMKWKTELKVNQNGVYEIPATAGTYTFICTNYSNFWLDGVVEDDVHTILTQETKKESVGKWSNIIIQHNAMTISVAANKTGKERMLSIIAESGDAFSYIIFKQARQE